MISYFYGIILIIDSSITIYKFYCFLLCLSFRQHNKANRALEKAAVSFFEHAPENVNKHANTLKPQ